MHVNMKFYVVSMGGIFISLGIGLLLGFNLNYDQELSNQQSEIIQGLDDKFEVLKNTNDSLKTELEELNLNYDKTISFINNNATKLTIGELESQKIGIITINANNIEYIQDTLINANGNIAFNINLTNKAFDIKTLEELSSQLNIEIKTTDDFISYLIEILNTEDYQTILKQIENLGIINIGLLEENMFNTNSIVLMNNTSEEKNIKDTQNIEKLIIEKLKVTNKYLVGVKAQTSSDNMNIYSELGISSISNIDEGIGQFTLVSLLKDRNVIGNFGSDEGSDNIILFK